jgi:hypothetical protein
VGCFYIKPGKMTSDEAYRMVNAIEKVEDGRPPEL